MKRWESICRRCGLCCYEKYRAARGIVVRTHAPCEFLDLTDPSDPMIRLCRVYVHRFERCPQCRKMTLFHALFSPYLPDTCGYVRTFRIWRRSARSRPAG